MKTKRSVVNKMQNTMRNQNSQATDGSSKKGVRILADSKIFRAFLISGVFALLAASVQAQIITFTPPDPGPPLYAILEPTFVPHTDDWAAVAFVRAPSCVPPGFNLLNVVNVPAAFGCMLTVQGHAIWKNAPPPVDEAPIQVNLLGLGAVPVWFVSWTEMQAALADNVLTVPELSSLPSLRIGSASFFKETQHPGPERPQGPGNGKIEINARGTLSDGRTFILQVREMGVDQESTIRHIRIEFK
ncbi:MAG: hypothetical protein WAU45_20325 [Blastocatellia bacterium]